MLFTIYLLSARFNHSEKCFIKYRMHVASFDPRCLYNVRKMNTVNLPHVLAWSFAF